jgi:hypothetical protein
LLQTYTKFEFRIGGLMIVAGIEIGMGTTDELLFLAA